MLLQTKRESQFLYSYAISKNNDELITICNRISVSKIMSYHNTKILIFVLNERLENIFVTKKHKWTKK